VLPKRSQGCTPQAPRLLRAGAPPLRPLRLDMRRIASTRAGQLQEERLHTVSHVGVGKPATTDEERVVHAVYTTHAAGADGRLPYSGRFSVSYPRSGTGTAGEFGYDGLFTSLNGGAYDTNAAGTGGTVVTDHFPSQPVGIGASWRVVNCQPIYDTPARETRTYTLRSLAHGVVDTTYTDLIALDPSKTDLGTGLVGGRVVHLRLESLDGTATGTMRVPLADGLAQRQRTVATLTATIRPSAAGAAPGLIRSRMTYTLQLTPVG
jgi:hypothetical protein